MSLVVYTLAVLHGHRILATHGGAALSICALSGTLTLVPLLFQCAAVHSAVSLGPDPRQLRHEVSCSYEGEPAPASSQPGAFCGRSVAFS